MHNRLDVSTASRYSRGPDYLTEITKKFNDDHPEHLPDFEDGVVDDKSAMTSQAPQDTQAAVASYIQNDCISPSAESYLSLLTPENMSNMNPEATKEPSPVIEVSIFTALRCI